MFADGDLGAFGTCRDALMKQKHRLIWERRHGKVGEGMKYHDPNIRPLSLKERVKGKIGPEKVTLWYNWENDWRMRINDGTDHISSYAREQA